MRIPVPIVLAAMLFVTPGYAGLDKLPLYGPDPQVTFTEVALYPDQPERRGLGPLTYLGGMAMASFDPAFGGFSAMTTDGRNFLLLSDGGNWMRFSMPVFGRPGKPTFGDLTDGPGGGWLKEDRDTEAMTADPATGRIWVAYERKNAIWRYVPGPGPVRSDAHVRPKEMRRWELNRGAEAMVRFADGQFLVLGEDPIWGVPDHFPAFLFARDPTLPGVKAVPLRYRTEDRYRVTDAAELPDGNLIVVLRRFDMPYRWRVRLGIIDRASIVPDGTAPVRTIAEFGEGTRVENYEALAVTREGKDVILWIACDDNQSILQQSLLMKFRLDMRKAGAE